jgi:uncharacterized protein (TIGR03435 family)
MRVLRFLPVAVAAGALFAQSAPPRLEFEVASIKPSGPITDNVHIGLRIDGAQVSCSQWSLKDYIRIAYRVKDYQVEGPDWIASERFDISAKLPQGATREQVNDMLQNLLVDRFKLTFHRVKKEFPVYALVVAKGGAKLKESNLDGIDPSTFSKPSDSVNASGSAAGVGVDLGQGSFFSLTDNKFSVKRLTMPRVAAVMERFVDRPVVDMTNLTGVYDMELSLTPEDYRGMLIRSAITAGVAIPPEAQRLAMTDIGESLASALQALGLRLEPRKAPLDVMVVDHAERSPSEN